MEKIAASGKTQERYAAKIKDIYIPEKDHITLNLMWINTSKSNDNALLFSETYKRRNEVINIFDRLDEWAEEGYEVNFWYDSETVGENSVALTQKAIQKNCKNAAYIHLKDVRELQIVQENPDAFTDAVPIYIRADLLRVIAAYETLSRSAPNSYFIYSDLSIEAPIPYDQLVADPETLYNLDTYGIVMSRADDEFENNFFIIANTRLNLLTATKAGLIDVNIQRIQDSLKTKSPYDFSKKEVSDNFIYSSYISMMRAFYTLERKAEWKKSNGKNFKMAFEKGWSISDLHEWFGEESLPSFLGEEARFKITDRELIAQKDTTSYHLFIPIKEVLAPPSQH